MSDNGSSPRGNADSGGESAFQWDEKKIPVVEIFGPTIEGEGAVIGTQTMFIRFGLCDYKCKKCDSMHSVDPKLVKKLARWLTQKQIFDGLIDITPEHIKTVTFSGGNPAIHELSELVSLLKGAGFSIVMETQGTLYKPWMKQVDHMVVSPKGPGMGEKFDPNVFANFIYHVLWDVQDFSIKVVVFSAQDLEFAAGVIGVLEDAEILYKDNFYLSLGNPTPPKFIDEGAEVVNESPSNLALVGDLLERYNQLAEEVMQDKRLSFAKFLPQLHVLVWGNETEK